MATLSENINKTITYLDEIRDAIIATGCGMEDTEIVDNYAEWIKELEFIVKLEVDKENIAVDRFGDTTSAFNIECNTRWTVSCNQNWVNLDTTSGFKDAVINLTFDKNNSSTSRTATITITAITLTKTIIVTQEAMLYGVVAFTVTSNIVGNFIMSGSFPLISSHGVTYELLVDLDRENSTYQEEVTLEQDYWDYDNCVVDVTRDGESIRVSYTLDPGSFTLGDTQTANIEIEEI